MINQSIEKALNKQINAELYSSYLYLAMAAYFENQNWNGFANWMKIQSVEEHAHGMKMFEFVYQRGGKVVLTAIEAPKTEWKSVLNVFEETLVHEQKITKSINDIYELSLQEKDHATSSFLQWFINEQVEEEDNVIKILESLKMVGESKNSLYFFNRELGKRQG